MTLQRVTTLSVCVAGVERELEGTPINGLYGQAPPERDIIFRLQVYERVGISLVEVYKRVVKYDISLCKKSQKG